jgi:hypothetical protein
MITLLKILVLLALAAIVMVGAPCGGLLILYGFNDIAMLGWGLLLLAISALSFWGLLTIGRSMNRKQIAAQQAAKDEDVQS